MPECWNAGMPWDAGMLECWNASARAIVTVATVTVYHLLLYSTVYRFTHIFVLFVLSSMIVCAYTTDM